MGISYKNIIMQGRNLVSIAAAIVVDPLAKYTRFVLNGIGTNNATNSTFVDSSSNNYAFSGTSYAPGGVGAITTGTGQGAFSPFCLPNGFWSNRFLGVSTPSSLPATLTFSANTAFALGTGDFTVEFWANLNVLAAGEVFSQSANGSLGMSISATEIWISRSNQGRDLTATVNQTVGTWSHYAVTRSGTTARIFKDGVQVATGTVTSNYGQNGFAIGNNALDGSISNFRVVKGTALYTANFTPSTTPLTAVANTSLLTCQSARFIDNSTNAFTATVTNDVRTIASLSPFLYDGTYSAATMGGSYYSDSANGGPALSTGPVIGSGAFTLELWFYPTATGEYITGNLSSNTNSPAIRLISTTSIGFGGAGTTTFTVPTIALNTWHHLAIVRSSTGAGGTTLFLNGVRSSTGAVTMATTFTALNTVYFTAGATAAGWFKGFISSLRLVTGSALYSPSSTTISLPTAPYTAVSGTALLLNGTNASVTDDMTKSVISTRGVKISTAQAKWGSSSLLFDSSNLGLVIAGGGSPGIMAYGDFTMEAWIYPTSMPASGISNDWSVFRFGYEATGVLNVMMKNGGSASTGAIYYNYNASGSTAFLGPATYNTVPQSVTSNQWTHLAIVRTGTALKCFVNGTQVSTDTSLSTVVGNNNPFVVGSAVVTSGTAPNATNSFKGYMQGVRYTPGVARYTTTFTPPTNYSE